MPETTVINGVRYVRQNDNADIVVNRIVEFRDIATRNGVSCNYDLGNVCIV